MARSAASKVGLKTSRSLEVASRGCVHSELPYTTLSLYTQVHESSSPMHRRCCTCCTRCSASLGRERLSRPTSSCSAAPSSPPRPPTSPIRGGRGGRGVTLQLRRGRGGAQLRQLRRDCGEIQSQWGGGESRSSELRGDLGVAPLREECGGTQLRRRRGESRPRTNLDPGEIPARPRAPRPLRRCSGCWWSPRRWNLLGGRLRGAPKPR